GKAQVHENIPFSAMVENLAGIEDVVRSSALTIQMGIQVARIELLDTVQMRACNAYSKISYAESPTLFLEFQGTDETVPL
ncbi:FAD-linked oxidase C-terminal domain-containing protein, partial [Rhizobium ruizarguesonis]